MARAPFLLTVYRGLAAFLSVAAPLWLARRAKAGKEDPARLRERYGITVTARPTGRLAWCHAASVGESQSLLPLVKALRERGCAVVITTGTVTSATLMAERLPAGALHQYVPLDHKPWAARFLEHWQPDVVLWAESELWPAMLHEIARRNIPAVLVNARLSDRALRGWQRWPDFAQHVIGCFTMVLAQSAEDARRFIALGARDVRTPGNLKLAAAPLPADAQTIQDLTALIGGRPAWLAASIHPGEDQYAADVHMALSNHHLGLLTIVAPRHPAKADAMTLTFQTAGLRVARRSAGELITTAIDVYMADTVGELGALYRVCNLVFMGKSLAVGGGQNPAEPAQLGCAVILGSDMSNFRDMTETLCAAGAAIQIGSAAALIETVDRLLSDGAARHGMAERARQMMAAESGALAKTLEHVAPLLVD